MADKKTSKPEEAKKDSKKAPKKKSNRKNPFKTIAKFFKGVNAERKKVIWPNAKETIRNTIIVLVVVLFVGVAIYAVDTGLSLGMKGLRTLKDKTETTTAETTTASSEDELNALLENAAEGDDSEAADDSAAEDTAEDTAETEAAE